MEEYLDFVTIDLWTLIFTWINLIILFLLLKKFLFKPIDKVLTERAAEIEDTYKNAETAKHTADAALEKYEAKLSDAKGEAEEIIKTASLAAEERTAAIVSEAREEAKRIVEKSQEQAERDRQSAMSDAQGDIASLAVDIAERLIGESIDSSIDEKLIEEIIGQMG